MSIERGKFNWDAIPIQTKTSADSAAGANPTSLTVPVGMKWRFHGCYFSMLTSAVAGNRLLTIAITPSTNAYLTGIVGTNAQTASTTHQYRINTLDKAAETLTGVVHEFGISMHPIELLAGAVISFTVAALDTTGGSGDNAGIVSHWVQEALA